MVNGALDRYKPLLLLVGSLAAASLLLYGAVFRPKVRAIDGLKTEAEAKQGRASESFRQWGEMSSGRHEETRAWEDAIARFDERLPIAPEHDRFMTEVGALVVRRKLRDFHLSVSEGAGDASTAQGPGAVAAATGATNGEAAPPPSTAAFAEIRYGLRFRCAYRDLADFLDDLPRMKRLVAIRSLVVREKDGEMETTLEVSTFHRGTT